MHALSLPLLSCSIDPSPSLSFLFVFGLFTIYLSVALFSHPSALLFNYLYFSPLLSPTLSFHVPLFHYTPTPPLFLPHYFSCSINQLHWSYDIIPTLLSVSCLHTLGMCLSTSQFPLVSVMRRGGQEKTKKTCLDFFH